MITDRARKLRKRGFTMVEVLVAGVITALVLGGLSTSLSQLGRVKRSSKERFDAFLRADAALNAIRSDVISITRSDDLFFTRLLLYDESVPAPDGDLARDELLVFNIYLRPVRDLDAFSGEGIEYETQYRVESDELGPVLWQRRDAMPDEYPVAGGMATPLVDGIVSIDVEVYDGKQWYEQWDSDIVGLPEAVAITVIASGHRPGEDVFDAPWATLRTVVPIDRVLPPRDIAETEEEELRALEAEEATAESAEGGAGDFGGRRPGDRRRPGRAQRRRRPRRRRRGPGTAAAEAEAMVAAAAVHSAAGAVSAHRRAAAAAGETTTAAAAAAAAVERSETTDEHDEDEQHSTPTIPLRLRRPSRGSVVIIVVWAVALAAIVVSSVQLFSFRQATLGRDAAQRIQTRWAARAGIENTIATLALHTQQPVENDAFAMIDDLDFISRYEDLFDASYDIRYHADQRDWPGPMDEHSKLNVNASSDGSALAILEDITPDVAAAIVDWMDEDDEPSLLGAESDWYRGLSNPVKPRNGPLRHILELEMIAGIWGEYVRGEDRDLDNRMDANENDGMLSLPDDEPDGILETGWSGRLTVHSVEGGATASGLPRLYLRRAEVIDVMDQCGVDEIQAETLIAFGGVEENTLAQLITVPLTSIDANGNVAGDDANPDVNPLTGEQLRAVLAECSILPLYDRRPGRVNINTASPDLIRDMLEMQGLPDVIADEIIYLRDSRAEGIPSVLDLGEIADVTPEVLTTLAGVFTTSSNVYTITSKGRSRVSGIEVEIIAVVDRSSVPIRILEYREQ